MCGSVGFFTLIYVCGKLFGSRSAIGRPTLVCIGIALGVMALAPLLFGGSWRWTLVGLLPLAVSAHIVFLARRMLISSWRDGLGKVAIATAVALSMLAIPSLEPTRASGNSIREQEALWQQRAPGRYEFTVQLIGYPSGRSTSPELLMPKRVRVEDGKVVSATYAWEGGDHYKAGDPARTDNLRTTHRTFTELLAAEERGGEVQVTYNEHWGFVEEARVSMNDGSNDSWTVEVRDFREILLVVN